MCLKIANDCVFVNLNHKSRLHNAHFLSNGEEDRNMPLAKTKERSMRPR